MVVSVRSHFRFYLGIAIQKLLFKNGNGSSNFSETVSRTSFTEK
jgi:hypothetical protein